jgi:transposase
MEQGESPTVVARILGVRRTSLYRWRAMAHASPDGLAAKPHPGPTPRLTSDQLRDLEGLLKEGAKAHGWKTQLWTAGRVADLIERRFSVHFHPEHVRKILKRRLKWTSQKPQRKAKERDEIAIAH